MDNTRHRARGRYLRRGRVSIPGQAYLVTIVTANRKPVFTDLRNARRAVRGLHDSGVQRQARTWAYVVMPDHVHWMLELSDDGNLSRVVQLYKAKLSHDLGQRIWQRGFHDHALRADEDMMAVSRYVVANPLRAGLATRIGDYPHWDAVWIAG